MMIVSPLGAPLQLSSRRKPGSIRPMQVRLTGGSRLSPGRRFGCGIAAVLLLLIPAVTQAAQPDLGSLTLVFTENPLILRQWTVVDQQGRRTTVSLSDLQLGVALDPRLFQYQYLFSAPSQ